MQFASAYFSYHFTIWLYFFPFENNKHKFIQNLCIKKTFPLEFFFSLSNIDEIKTPLESYAIIYFIKFIEKFHSFYLVNSIFNFLFLYLLALQF